MKIALLVTGGTFDKEYNELAGALYFKRTHVREMLSLGRARLDIIVRTLMLKDSLHLTETDRVRILRACQRSRENKIVITHGTDTMETTARYLGARLSGKTVVLTGAMVPYKFGSSDGLFNLGSALAFVQVLPAGVYVAMNGHGFTWQDVCKNRKGGYFERRVKSEERPRAQRSQV
jgi:L-asparaginase